MDVDKQMQIIENLIQTGIKVLLVTPFGIEGDRARHRQGQQGGHPGGGGGHARGSAGGQGRGHHRRLLHRIGQLRGREDRGQLPPPGHGRQGERRRAGGDPRARDGRPAAARVQGRGQGREGDQDRRLPDRELGARPGLHRLPEHAGGAPGDRRRLLRQRHDGAGRGGGDRGQGQDGQDQGRRLRRGRRRRKAIAARARSWPRSRSSRRRWGGVAVETADKLLKGQPCPRSSWCASTS